MHVLRFYVVMYGVGYEVIHDPITSIFVVRYTDNVVVYDKGWAGAELWFGAARVRSIIWCLYGLVKVSLWAWVCSYELVCFMV